MSDERPAVKHPRSPCGDCPYRTDSPTHHWAPFEFEKVLAADAHPQGMIFGCHKHASKPDGERGLCAGYLLDQRARNTPSLVLRVRMLQDKSAAEAQRVVSARGKPMYPNLAAMCEANGVTKATPEAVAYVESRLPPWARALAAVTPKVGT